MDHILDPSLTIAWKVAIGVEKPANEIRETIRLDQRYLFDHAKTTLASRIDQLDKGTAPKDVNWGMEAVVAGSMYKGISVEKRVETLYNLSVQKGQLTSAQQKELGDTHDLTSSNFIVHASTMGSMSMEKAEFQKGLERIAEGQTYLGYALINVAVGKMTQYNLDAGVGISNYDDPANSRFKIESKRGVAAGDVATGSITVAPVATQSVSQSTPQLDTLSSGKSIAPNVGTVETIELPTSSKITGYTDHGADQALGRDGGIGVSNKAMLDAVENPVETKFIPDNFGGTTRYIGKDATVALNKNGRVVTTWANGREGTR